MAINKHDISIFLTSLSLFFTLTVFLPSSEKITDPLGPTFDKSTLAE